MITDLEMPRTNGYELMMHLRQTPATSKVPVMVVTSRAGAKHRERALKEGAAAFMVKPVQEESFDRPGGGIDRAPAAGTWLPMQRRLQGRSTGLGTEDECW